MEPNTDRTGTLNGNDNPDDLPEMNELMMSFCFLLEEIMESLHLRMVELEKRLTHLEAATEINSMGDFKWVENSVACRYLGISKRQIAYCRAKGKLSYSKLGKKIYYERPELEKHREILIRSGK